MKFHRLLLALSLGFAAPAAAQVPGLDVDLRAGVNITSIGDAPDGVETSDDLGYFVGGDIRFGKFFFVQPGLYYQHQTVNFDDNLGTSDGIGVSSFMIPLQVGVDVDLKILGAELGVGPTLTFNTSVGDNDFGIEKDNLNNTRFGGLVSAKAYVLFIGGFIGYQFDFTEAFKDANAGGFNQWMFGLGVNF
jgi:hypothetical protein